MRRFGSYSALRPDNNYPPRTGNKTIVYEFYYYKQYRSFDDTPNFKESLFGCCL